MSIRYTAEINKLPVMDKGNKLIQSLTSADDVKQKVMALGLKGVSESDINIVSHNLVRLWESHDRYLRSKCRMSGIPVDFCLGPVV